MTTELKETNTEECYKINQMIFDYDMGHVLFVIEFLQLGIELKYFTAYFDDETNEVEISCKRIGIAPWEGLRFINWPMEKKLIDFVKEHIKKNKWMDTFLKENQGP